MMRQFTIYKKPPTEAEMRVEEYNRLVEFLSEEFTEEADAYLGKPVDFVIILLNELKKRRIK